jgi:hypothetical protein
MFLPSLCVIEDSDYEAALEILKSRQAEPPIRTTEWKCAACSQMNPPNFDSCWNCNAVRPGV